MTIFSIRFPESCHGRSLITAMTLTLIWVAVARNYEKKMVNSINFYR